MLFLTSEDDSSTEDALFLTETIFGLNGFKPFITETEFQIAMEKIFQTCGEFYRQRAIAKYTNTKGEKIECQQSARN